MKILVLISGKEGKDFLAKIINNYLNVAEFDVLYKSDEDIEKSFLVDNVRFYKVNPSNFAKLALFLKRDYEKIIIILKNKIEAIESYNNIRFVNKDIHIDFVDFWDKKFDDKNLTIIHVSELITSKLIDFLPNVPVFANNIGLGKQEILEVQVPVYSSFVYQRVGQIRQRKWKIAAIYRNEELILPTNRTIILPNDQLILIGEPNIILSVFKTIKKERGVFPAPYGNNIYILIDMLKMKQKEISQLIKMALFLHRKMANKKFIIRVVNPTIETKLSKLEKFKNIDINIDYFRRDLKEVVLEDKQKFNIGLFITTNKFFFRHIEFLETLKIPILKLGKYSLKKCENAGIFVSKNKYIEKVSLPLFDISTQLKLNVKILDFDPDNEEKQDIIDYFKNISRIYNKKIEILSSENNPVNEGKKLSNICFFHPLDDKLAKVNYFSAYFSPSIEKSFIFLQEYNYIFIPTIV